MRLYIYIYTYTVACDQKSRDSCGSRIGLRGDNETNDRIVIHAGQLFLRLNRDSRSEGLPRSARGLPSPRGCLGNQLKNGLSFHQSFWPYDRAVLLPDYRYTCTCWPTNNTCSYYIIARCADNGVAKNDLSIGAANARAALFLSIFSPRKNWNPEEKPESREKLTRGRFANTYPRINR